MPHLSGRSGEPRRFGVTVFLAAAMAMGAATPAGGQDEPPPDDQDSTVIDIFPNYLPRRGYYEDAIIRTRDGRYLVYTGWYFDSLEDQRLSGTTHQFRDFGEFQSALRARALEQEPLTHPYEQRVAPFARSLGIAVSADYVGMTLVQIAPDFGFDPYGPTSAVGINRGIYGATPFNSLPNQLTQVSGSINFGEMESAPVWQALRK